MTRARASTVRRRAAMLPPVALAAIPTAVPAHRSGRAVVLGLICFVIYLTSVRTIQVWDTLPTRLIPFSVLREGNTDLNEFEWVRSMYPKPFYMFRTRSGRWMSRYSPVLSVLVAPLWIPVVWYFEHDHISDDDVRFRLATLVMERIAAAAVAAASVSVLFLALQWVTPATGIATAIALAYGLGTSLWAIGSQTLLQHGMAALILAALSLALVRAPSRRTLLLAGVLAVLGVAVRPTMVMFAVLALIFVWRERRAYLWSFAAVPIVGATALLAYNSQLKGMLRGGYGEILFAPPGVWRFVGLLFSPNRGLLIFTPAALLALPVLRWCERLPRWVSYLPAGIAGYILLYSCWLGWWGGATYGPRFLTDTMPAFALCAVPAVERLWRRRLGQVLLIVLAGWGVAVQAIGAHCDDGSWNVTRKAGKAIAQRIWDWNNLQFIHALRGGVRGPTLAPRIWQALTDPRPALLRPMSARDLAGEVVVEDAMPLRVAHGSAMRVHVRVTNRSTAMWPTFTDHGYLQVRLAYRWWSSGSVLPIAGAIGLPRNIGPNESIRREAPVALPKQPGLYELELVVIQLLGADKGISGGAVARAPVEVY